MKASSINKYLYKLMLVLTVSLVLISCKKGDSGPIGPQGEQGEQGTIGLPGENGTTIYSGATAPATTLGAIGDFYLNKTTDQLYGPKTSSGWGTATNLKGTTGNIGATGAKGDKGDKGATGSTGTTGATGAKGDKGATGTAGTDGSVILSGTTVPTSATGKEGDYYLNKSTFLLYGPKLASTWGTPVNLKGAKGDKGDKGDKGATGSSPIQYTNWYTPTAAQWTIIAPNTIYYIFTIPGLTLDILNKGVILGYANPGTGPFPLPITIDIVNIIFQCVAGKIMVQYYNSDGSTLAPPDNLGFRFVLIPGGTTTPISLHPSYTEVKRAFTIPE